MDQLSSLYVRMASGTHSQLHNPTSVMGFVDQMQSRMEKSSAPRKSFLIDPSTPHSDVVIAESSALKPSVGWVTLQVTEGIRRGIHEWGIKIEHQGESNDESGLMLGIVPRNFSKYDTFISQGGGWCLSRAGKFYGHWRRTDTGGGALTFGTGDRVVLTLDYEAAVMTVRVGEKVVVGELSGLTMEVFPAVSLHYRHQHIRFDHHAIRETSAHHLPWRQRQTFPLAPAYMPLSFQEVQRLPLNSYLFSGLFQKYISLERSSVVTMEEDRSVHSATPGAASASSSRDLMEREHAEQRAMRLYMSTEASAARLTVLSRAFAAVRRYVVVQPGKTSFLSPHVSAEYLRQRLYEATRASTLRGGGSSGTPHALFPQSGSSFTVGGNTADSSSGSSSVGVNGAGYDAALNCGAVIVVHLFIRAVSSGQEVATQLVLSFRDFLLTLPIFSLVEGRTGGSVLAPDTVQLAVDHVVRLLDASAELSDGAAAAHASPTTVVTTSALATSQTGKKKAQKDVSGDAPVSACTAALLEVAILLALQRGLVSEVLRVCRHLLRAPPGTLSPALVEWLRGHTAGLIPRQSLPDIGRVLRRACEDPASFIPTQIDPSTVVLSVAYGAGSSALYLHTAEALSKWGPSAATPYVLLVDTRQPSAYCVGASRSSMAVTHSHVLLLTDRMVSAEVALVMYSFQLDQHQVLRWADMHSSWPRALNANPQLTTMSEDGVLLLFERSAPMPVRTANGAAAVAGTPASAVANIRGVRHSIASSPLCSPSPLPTLSVEWEVVAHGYSATTAASLSGAPLWTRTLQPPPPVSLSGLRLDRCLLLRKPSLVDLGSPEDHLTVAGGYVTVELWVQFLDKEDAATLYQHGDRSTNGEVFLELIKWEGLYCIRGGYRHDVRGSFLVSAPLPPTAESRPLHVGLIFNGRWRLFFDGEEVAGNRQGPHVSLDAPKQRWTVGAGCTCLLMGLRVWRLGRTAREMSRDFRRSLVGDEPGLVAQFFFNERGGNVVLNYVHQVKTSHAVCSGSVAHVSCGAHPWRNYGASSALLTTASSSSLSASVPTNSASASSPSALGSPLALNSTPACARLHEWRDLTLTTCCVTRHTLLLSTPIGDASPYPTKDGGRALMFFDLASGVAHRSLFLLTHRSPVRHWMRADPAGRLWEMFEVDANLVKGGRESSYLLSLLNATGSAPQQPRERILAVVPLPLEEEEGAERLCTFVDSDHTSTSAAASFSCDVETNSSNATTATTIGNVPTGGAGPFDPPAEPDQSMSQLLSFAALVEQPSATVSYAALALWLLKLLAAHADADTDTDQALFTPLADDVSSRCVTEVRAILGEHFRVVKASNARRAIALRSSLSWVVVATALRVLLRLIRCARAFGLHPGPLRLTVVKDKFDEDESGSGKKNATTAVSSEVTMTFLLRELHTSSMRRRTAPSTPATSTAVMATTNDGFDNADSSTLLGLLADIINEDGLTLPPVVVALARTVTVEGVGLFLPNVRQRAKLLRDLLRTSSFSTSVTSTTVASLRSPRGRIGIQCRKNDGGSSSNSNVTGGEESTVLTTEERVPAMNVLLDAVAQSFTTVLAAAPLLCIEDGVASLSDVCDTLHTLLEESAVQWRRKWTLSSASSCFSLSLRGSRTPSANNTSSTTAIKATRITSPSSTFHAFASSLSEAIASLQLLLLSACQGSRWEVALTQMHAKNGAGGNSGGINNTSDRSVGGVGALNNIGDSSDGGSGGGLTMQSNLGGLACTRDTVSAAALDLQHLCLSQAASYHPCVRTYYTALFASAESCLSLCVQQQQDEEQQQRGGPDTQKQASSGPSWLPAMVASLAPTFLTAPLHTALSAIPLVLTVEDGEWFLASLDKLLLLSEKLLDTVAETSLSENPISSNSSGGSSGNHPAAVAAMTMVNEANHSGGSSVIAARRLLSSLRESLYYASVWVAAFLFNSSTTSTASVKEEVVRQRLGLSSVTATPTAQRTVTNLTATLDGTLGEKSTMLLPPNIYGTLAEEEAAAIWEHPLLEGGIWADSAGTDAGSPQQVKQDSTSAHPRRDVYMKQLIRNSAYWSAKQITFDQLASKTSTAMAPLITTMSATALHLSSLPLQSFTAAQVDKMMCDVMRQLSRPVRTELMSRREEEAANSDLTSPLSARSPASGQRALEAMLKELQQRCELLLRVRTCSELWQMEDVLFALPACDTEPTATTTRAASSTSPLLHQKGSTKRKLREAWHSYELRHMRYRAHVASRPSCTLHEAIQLVKRVVLSCTTTSASLLAALRQRENLAALREAGIQHLLRLVKRAPCSVESVAQLLSAQGRGVQSHFEDGLRGCGYDSVEHIRRVFYELLRFSISCKSDQRNECAGGPFSLFSSATVLCGLLDRAWQPRELALLVQLRVVPTLMERYLTLFKPLPETSPDSSSLSARDGIAGDKTRARRPSHVVGAKTNGSSMHSTTVASPTGPIVTGRRNSRPCSVELRPVALLERRHRDQIVAAQQARRSSKSALVSSTVLRYQSTTGESGQASGGSVASGADGPPQYTANEAMQAQVWLTMKHLMLQSTEMLTAQRLSSMSRVEQTAVMSFLSDALSAVGVELRHCHDVLARAVRDTPVLLAQAGDAAVLEPLVTVQDQVDVLCSLLSVVAGTLSTAAAVTVAATSTSTANTEEKSGDAVKKALFVNTTLSTVCASIAETLLEFVYLDIYHAHVVRKETGVGCVVRDAAACARIAGLLLCRCQPAAVFHFAPASPQATAAASSLSSATWEDFYASPVFTALPLAASSNVDGGHACLQRWLDLGTYAVATSGLSRTTQHVLLAFRRLLDQPAWAAELHRFAAAYKRLLLTYVNSIQASVGEGKDGQQQSSGKGSPNSRVREVSAVQLYVWIVALGGQLLVPPADLGMQVSYLDEKDGFQPTLAYVVDVESVSASSTSVNTSSTAALSPQTAATTTSTTSRHVRGASHFFSKMATAIVADGDRVRSVVVVPADPAGGHNREAEEVSLSPHQLFLPAWDDPMATLVTPYAGLVEDFVIPVLQRGIPLLTEKMHTAVVFTAVELSVFVSVLHLTAAVMRARSDLARRLIESGTMQSIRQHALQGVVRLPFPLKALKEWAALVAVRAAEEVAEHIYSREEEDGGANKRKGEEVRTARSTASPRSSSPASTSRSTCLSGTAASVAGRTPADLSHDNNNTSSDTPLPPVGAAGGRPAYASTSSPSPTSHGSAEALLDTFRSGGLSTSTPTFLPGGFVMGGVSSPGVTASPVDPQMAATAALARDTAGDYGLLRLARSFSVFTGAYGGASISAALSNTRRSPVALMNTATLPSTMTSNNINGSAIDASGTPVPARIPPHTELETNGGLPMFLSFPMWDAHPPSSDASSVGGRTEPLPIPAAVTITPSRPEGRFPIWDDGFAIETAVIFNDGDAYPAMGDSLSIPCSHARVSATDYEEDSLPPASPSPFEFPLITLYGAADPTAPAGAALFPFIQIKVHRSCLSVTITFPPTAGAGACGEPETVFVTKPMRREDWHHCMHVSLMCSSSCVMLCRNGEAANVELRGDVGRRLEMLLRQDGFIRVVVLGRPVAAPGAPAAETNVGNTNSNNSSSSVCATPVREIDGPMALLGGLRIWGSSVLRTSVRVVAELVARDHALQPFGLPEHLCFFEMKEGSGGVIFSADTAQQYCGVFSGGVRWSIEPLPLGFYPSIELNSGRAHSGVATAPVSSTCVPRSSMATLIQSLSSAYFARFAGDVMWSLLSMAARHTTVTALEVGMSPSYELLHLSNEPASGRRLKLSLFDPRQVLDAGEKLPYQLMRLFQLQDSGCLPNKYERLIHGVVQRLVTVLAADTDHEEEGAGVLKEDAAPTKLNAGGKPMCIPQSVNTSSSVASPSTLAAFVSDTALLLRQLRRVDGEVFVMELPPAIAASSMPASSSTSSPTPHNAAVLPIALTNGGTGVLTFDTKYRNMEQATLYKDHELKNILAKYPDGQGGWPAYTLTAAEAPWAYLRSVPSSIGHRLAMDGKASEAPTSSILAVTVKSLKPVILHATVRALCDALRTQTRSEEETTMPSRRSDGRSQLGREDTGYVFRAAAGRLLDARVVASLIQQSSARSSDDDCVHFVLILTQLLQLWRRVPQVSPYDQLPLSLAMSHLNLPLCSIVQHLNGDADLGSLVSATTGTYSPYVQALVGLWTASIQVDCAWAGRTYVEQLRARWQRLLQTWQRAAVHRPTEPLLSPHTNFPSVSNEKAGRSAGLSTTDTSTGQQAPQPYTPPSSPGMRANPLPVDVAYTRAQLRVTSLTTTTTTTNTDTPSAPESELVRAAQRGALLSALTLSKAPIPVGLVTVEASAPVPRLPHQQVEAAPSLPSPTNREETLKDVSARDDTKTTRTTLFPRGVTRKGNGVWIVKGSNGSGDNTADANRGDAARKSSCANTVRSSVGFTSGAVYWEVYVTNISRVEHPPSVTNGATLASNVLVGVTTERSTRTFTVSSPDGAGVFLGNDSESWIFDGGRALRYYKGYRLESSPRTKWKMDDVIGFVLDVARNRFCCLHNGRLVSEFNGSFLSPQQRAEHVALFPVVICAGEGSCEVNFGGAGFASAPPPGCLPVDPSLYVSEETARVWQLVLAEELVMQGGRESLTRMNSGSNNSNTAVEGEEGATESSDTGASVMNDGSEQNRSSRRAPLLQHPALPYICRHLVDYTTGRFGPLDVMLLCRDSNAKTVSSRECKADKDPVLLFGSVAVTAGRWYFEVVLPGEPTFHVGWHAWKALEEQGAGIGAGVGRAGGGAQNGTGRHGTPTAPTFSSPSGRPQLGHDASSWGLDAARMIARHNKRQMSLARRVWKCGDVVGCLLDCDAGTATFTVNGEALVETLGAPTTNATTTISSTISGSSPLPTPPPPPRRSPSPYSHSRSASTSAPRGQSEGQPSSHNNNADTTATAVAPHSIPSPLFTDISLSDTRGLVPAILLEPKSSLVCLWNEGELLYPPDDGSYRVLGGTHVVRNALVEMVTQEPTKSNSKSTKSVKKRVDAGGVSNGGVVKPTDLPSRCLNWIALRRLLYYASRVQELHPNSLRSYTMPSLYSVQPRDSARQTANNGSNSTDDPQSPSSALSSQQQQQQQRDLCSASGLDLSQLHTHLAALLFFAHLSAFLYPFAHAALLPFTVEDTPLGSNWAMTDLHRTLNLCRAIAPPWTALRMLLWSLDASNGAGDAVRLSVNRRKALTVVGDLSASTTRRLRDSVFGQVYQLLSTKPPALFTTNKKMWAVTFYGEGADDVGGPYRECLTQMCAELMSASLTLFLPSPNATSELGEVRDGFVVNPVCAPPVELPMYRFLGRFMGGCLRGGEPLALYLPSALWKYLVGEAADDADIARVDVATLNAMEYVVRVAGATEEDGGKAMVATSDEEVEERNAELAEFFPGGFTLLNDAGVEDELVPGGSQIPVTVRNAGLYARLVREHKLYGSGAAQRRALQQGFHEVVPLCTVAGLKWYELEALVCGQCDYDPDALLDAARYDGMEATDIRVSFLREVLRGFTRHQRALFMRFVSGRERLPPGIHLKIMPDDVPHGNALPTLASPIQPTSQSIDTTAGVMTPQPPSPHIGNEGSGHENSNGTTSSSGGGGNNARSGTFIRHSAYQHGRLNSGLNVSNSSQAQQPPLPPSPPQLGFTPPPSMPLLPQLSRAMPSPPVLQPRQLLSGQHSASTASPVILPPPPAHTTRHTVPVSQPHNASSALDVDLALCDDARLPHASTCFYWLRLPRYSSAAVMAEKLLFAIEQCVDIDADFRVHDTDVAEQEAGPSLARVSSDEDDLFEDFSHLR